MANKIECKCIRGVAKKKVYKEAKPLSWNFYVSSVMAKTNVSAVWKKAIKLKENSTLHQPHIGRQTILAYIIPQR